MPNSPKKIAITIGDPAGVGAEVILKWARENPRLLPFAEVIAHEKFLGLLTGAVSKRAVGDPSYEARAGSPDEHGARVAFEALEASAAGCVSGEYAAVVTAPISKIKMRAVGFEFAGQTEFFAARWGGEPVMAFAGEKLLVSLATWHIPLRDVPSAVDFPKIARAVRAAAELAKRAKGISEPRIGVCGINPHAGEDGILGREEIEVVNPALDILRAQFPNLSAALPPDTVFERALKGEFDAVVSMYHDQGLAPLKALEFDKAVNVSMNLGFLRTSPDHGTGFSIAGKGVASAGSFAAAFDLAAKMTGIM